MYFTNKNKTLFYSVEKDFFTKTAPYDSDLKIDKDIFSGLKTDLKKQDSLKKEIDKLEEIERQIYSKKSKLKKQELELEIKIKEKINKKYIKKYNQVPIKKLYYLVNNFIQNNFPDKDNNDESRYPRDGEFGGSIYMNYDGERQYFRDIFEENYKPLFKKEISVIDEKLKPLNKQLKKYNIQLKTELGLSIGDKSTCSYIYVYIDDDNLNNKTYIELPVFKKVKKILDNYEKNKKG